MNNPIEEGHDIDHSWTILKNNIYKAAEEAVGKRKVNLHVKPNTKP